MALPTQSISIKDTGALMKISVYLQKTWIVLTLLLLNFAVSAQAAGPQDMGAGKKTPPTTSSTTPANWILSRARVQKIFTVVPMPGMAPATAILVEEAEDAVNVVHICPEWFAGPQDIGLRRGDRVNVKGSGPKSTVSLSLWPRK
jgi:hypothetical protein